MDRRDYTDRVLSSLRRVTEKEREAIRSELDGHIEDHMEALRELGYDEELAEERAIAAMGEPDEVGRELNRQYTGWGWVLVSRAAVVLTVVLCAQALLALGILGMVIDSISARIYPNEPSAYTAVAATERLDIRIPVGNDILRVYRISIGQADDTPVDVAAEGHVEPTVGVDPIVLVAVGQQEDIGVPQGLPDLLRQLRGRHLVVGPVGVVNSGQDHGLPIPLQGQPLVG